MPVRRIAGVTRVTAGPVTADEVLDAVRRACATVLGVDPRTVTRDTRFADDLGADSLARVEVVEIVEQLVLPRAPGRFHVEDEDLGGLTTVGEAVDLVLSYL